MKKILVFAFVSLVSITSMGYRGVEATNTLQESNYTIEDKWLTLPACVIGTLVLAGTAAANSVEFTASYLQNRYPDQVTEAQAQEFEALVSEVGTVATTTNVVEAYPAIEKLAEESYASTVAVATAFHGKDSVCGKAARAYSQWRRTSDSTLNKILDHADSL